MRTTNTLSIMCAILVGLTSTMASAAFAATQSSPANNLKPANKKAIIQKVVKLQMPFIANQGQIQDERVRFYAQTLGGTFYVTQGGQMVHSL